MVELVLFLGTFAILGFLPVQFRIYYRKLGKDDELLFELSFLRGLIKRRKEITVRKPTSQGTAAKVEKSGHWFWWGKSQVKTETEQSEGNSRELREFLQRYQAYGLGITLLTYFLPAQYHRWLYVAEGLERRGKFTQFRWYTRFGTGEAASTAVLSGLIWAVKASMTSWLNGRSEFAQKPDLRVIPDFQTLRLDLLFDCIFKVNLGYIIIAAFIARLRQRLKGGVGI